MKYKRRSNNIDLDYQYYLGQERIFGIMFGHKLTKNNRQKAKYIWNRLIRQFNKHEIK